MKKAVLMLCLLFAGCDEDELAISRSENIQAEDISQKPVGEAVNQVSNQSNEIVTPEPSTYILVLFGMLLMFWFSDWSYKFKD